MFMHYRLNFNQKKIYRDFVIFLLEIVNIIIVIVLALKVELK